MTEQIKTVELYSLSTCPWSRSARAFLDERGVKYLYVDYDLADAHEQERIRDEMLGRGAAAFPFVKIGDEFIVGYNPDAFARLLDDEESLTE